MIYRYTAQTDIVIGTPISNRNKPELLNLIGFFVNTLASRTTFKDDASFRELLDAGAQRGVGARMRIRTSLLKKPGRTLARNWNAALVTRLCSR